MMREEGDTGSMHYHHRTETCFADAIGADGLARADFEAVLAETAPALTDLRALHDQDGLPILKLPSQRADLKALEPVANRIRSAFADVVILGTGGSSLGGQTLCALADRGFGPKAGAPRLHFMDNIDPDSFASLFDALDPARTGFLVISKSGGTPETMAQFLISFDWVRAAAAVKDAAAHFFLVTEPGDNPLRELGQRLGLETLDHDPGVGGRYSAFSLVGLLPAMIAGLDAMRVRAGADDVLDDVFSARDPDDAAPAVGAAIAVGLLRSRGIATTVLMPYIDRLAPFGLWFRQLWAESLGKDGTGTTPIRALGTVDQHSQLQLYLAGPRDKMYSLITLDCADMGASVDAGLADDKRLSYLGGRTMGDLLDAEQRATTEALARNGRPVRLFRLESLDERVMGALMMHFMLETVVTARLLGVDPFDQPAVEEGKILARAYLAGEETRA